MATPIPLHPGAPQPEEPLDNPDVLVLNALLHSGRWNPEDYGLRKEMLAGYQQAWNFCQEIHDQTGGPPTVDHFARSFPTIEMLAGVPVEWAVGKVKQAHYEREMRRQLMGAIAHLNNGEHEQARMALLEVSKPSPSGRLTGMSVYDDASVAEATIKVGWDTYWGRLKAVTGGPGRGELWYRGARLGQGKSWAAVCDAAAAAEQGARVAIASVEMPAPKYLGRLHAVLARNDLDLLRAIRSVDEGTRLAALHALPKLPGSVDVFDPSHMPMDLLGIETLASEYDIVVADHVGLLKDSSGKRSIEDWRVAAAISNTLKELTLRYRMTIIGIAQINREGDTGMPKLSHLSQSDALGQDGDVIILQRQMGQGAMKYHIAKNRDGRQEYFYTRFDPAKADFNEITKDQARDIAALDADRAADA